MNEEGTARLIEGLSLVVIIAGGFAIAVPKYGDLQRRETARQVLSDIEVVREAVYGFYSDSAYFPAEAPGTRAPGSLAPYLPRGFSFTRPYGTIEYRNWPVTAPPEGSAANVVGATVTTSDPRVGATAITLSPGMAQFTVGNKYTFLFFGG